MSARNILVVSIVFAAYCLLPGLACGDDDDSAEGGTDDDSSAGPDDDAVNDDDADDDTVFAPSWDNFARQFFSDYCTRCHAATLSGTQRNAAPSGVDYDTFQAAAANAGGAKARAGTDAGGMPPGTPIPTTAERATLVEWVDAGAPEK